MTPASQTIDRKTNLIHIIYMQWYLSYFIIKIEKSFNPLIKSTLNPLGELIDGIDYKHHHHYFHPWKYRKKTYSHKFKKKKKKNSHHTPTQINTISSILPPH